MIEGRPPDQYTARRLGRGRFHVLEAHDEGRDPVHRTAIVNGETFDVCILATAARARPQLILELVARMLKERLPNALAHFLHRITNARSEGIDRKTAALKKAANGFRNRDNFKTAISFPGGGLDLHLSQPPNLLMHLKNNSAHRKPELWKIPVRTLGRQHSIACWRYWRRLGLPLASKPSTMVT